MRHSIAPARHFRRYATLLAVIWLTASLNASAQASPIRHHLTKYQQLLITWAPFLAKGPSFWATHKAPTFPAGVTLPMQNGLLVQTSLVTYLEWRRNLDPPRFDHWHPRLGPELAQLLPPTTTTPNTPTTPTTPTTPQGQGLETPEPPGVAVALALGGAGAWWRSRRARGSGLG